MEEIKDFVWNTAEMWDIIAFIGSRKGKLEEREIFKLETHGYHKYNAEIQSRTTGFIRNTYLRENNFIILEKKWN